MVPTLLQSRCPTLSHRRPNRPSKSTNKTVGFTTHGYSIPVPSPSYSPSLNVAQLDQPALFPLPPDSHRVARPSLLPLQPVDERDHQHTRVRRSDRERPTQLRPGEEPAQPVDDLQEQTLEQNPETRSQKPPIAYGTYFRIRSRSTRVTASWTGRR
jgi:hypothetical protein